ncbi:MAG: uracil-DNA glycosylase [Candidatus Hydrogenedens sp.]|nr:uracil-DNA glycosylase [Candidatus Hydrogenedens sp.]
MNVNEELQSLLEDLIAFINQEYTSKKTVNISQECAQRWDALDPHSFAKHIKRYSLAFADKGKSEISNENSDHQNETEQQELEQREEENSLEHIQHQLNLLKEEVKKCVKCPLHTERTQTVFGTGNPQAKLVFVGEAPGAEEDRQGLPFVGRAGQLLTDIIVKGMKMRREDVYICNVLKCRPPENRDPNPMEVFHCEPYLLEQLRLIKPKVICALGRIAAQTLLKTDAPTNELRGKWHNYHGIPLRVTYHPAYLLRNPKDKVKTWTDIQEIIKLLNDEIMVELDEGQKNLL